MTGRVGSTISPGYEKLPYPRYLPCTFTTGHSIPSVDHRLRPPRQLACIHLGELVDAGLIARIRAPEDTDGRQTFYRITHLGQQELTSDVQNITGSEPS